MAKGKAELRQLASRLLALFPSLLLEKNLKRISLRSSSKHRCVSSMEALQEGLWRRPGPRPRPAQLPPPAGATPPVLKWCVVLADPQYQHVIDDQLLRFFEHCRGYVEGVEKNRTALQEVHKFKHGEEMEAVRRRTARRLGLHHQRLTTGLTHTHTHSLKDFGTQTCVFVILTFPW